MLLRAKRVAKEFSTRVGVVRAREGRRSGGEA